MPTGERWIRFTIGNVFPADSVVARFIVALAMIETDLLAVQEDISRRAEDEDRVDHSPELVARFWDAASQLREAAKFISDAFTNPEVVDYVGQLPDEAKEAAAAVLAACEPWEGSFVQRVTKPIRDQRFHYPMLDEIILQTALDEASTQESGVRVRGETMGDVRAVFADDLRGRILLRYLGGDLEEIGASMAQVAELTSRIIRLSQHSFTHLLRTLPADAYDASDFDAD